MPKQILAGSLLKLNGSGIVQGIQIKVSGVDCTEVNVIDSSNLLCTMTGKIDSVTVVTTQYPGSPEQKNNPEVVYIDADFDGVPDIFIENQACPNGPCKGEDCGPIIESIYDRTYYSFTYGPCIVDNCVLPVENIEYNDRCSVLSFNPSQSDLDGDGVGDSCDTDIDGDGRPNHLDPSIGYVPEYSYYEIGIGLGCYDDSGSDRDGDGIPDWNDPYPDGEDTYDTDQDGVPDMSDNCPYDYTPYQLDANKNGIGDLCDYSSDSDGDGVKDFEDICPAYSNPEQEPVDLSVDLNRNGYPDNCGEENVIPYVPIPYPKLTKVVLPATGLLPKGTVIELEGENFLQGIKVNLGSRVCSAVQACNWVDPGEAPWMVYSCGYIAGNCKEYSHAQCTPTSIRDNSQKMSCALDKNVEFGDGTSLRNFYIQASNAEAYSSQVFFTLSSPDSDNDGTNDISDNCPNIANDQKDADGDHLGDACDSTPNGNDIDSDGVLDALDNCAAHANPDQADIDDNGVGDLCDFEFDGDNDGYKDLFDDNCPFVANDQSDSDNDRIGDACDSTPQGRDFDKDGIADLYDNCPYVKNPDQSDLDGDVKGDACDEQSNLPAQVESIDAPSLTSLLSGSMITLHGSNFVSGISVEISDNRTFCNENQCYRHACTNVKVLSSTELTCVTDYIKGLSTHVWVANPGAIWTEYTVELVVNAN